MIWTAAAITGIMILAMAIITAAVMIGGTLICVALNILSDL